MCFRVSQENKQMTELQMVIRNEQMRLSIQILIIRVQWALSKMSTNIHLYDQASWFHLSSCPL